MSVDASRLLAWYDERKRDLPWRRTPIDPYRVWISEIMLQQTRVDTVIGYYERFLARFPTVNALANARLDDVLALWSGLGYYARARNLHRAAQRIRDEHAGRFPDDANAVRALPGIGDYTAGAVLSIAFGRREALVDGNVIRVLARVRALAGNPKESRLKNACWDLARALVPAERPGDFNQALMELGATVCTPRSPRCGECPISRACSAREQGRAEEIPATPPKAKRPHRRVDCAVIARGDRVLLVRRPDEGLLGGLWELPSAPKRGRGGATLPEAIADALGLAVSVGRRAASVEHAFSHFDLTLDAFACEASGEVRDAAGLWVARENLAAYGMGAAMRRVLEISASGGNRAKRACRREKHALISASAPSSPRREARPSKGTSRSRRRPPASGKRRPRTAARRLRRPRSSR